MKQFKIIKTTAKYLIAFSVLCVMVVIISTKFYLKADDVEIKPSSIMSISTLIDKILITIEYFLGILAFVGIVISGIQFGTTGGDPTNAAKAKKTLMYSIIGIILAVLSFAITKSVFGLLS